MTKEKGQKEVKVVEIVADKKVELIGVSCVLYPDAKAARTARDIRTGTEIKFEVSLPIPTTDEDAKRWYNTTLSALMVKGVKQHSYDNDTDTGTAVKADPNMTGEAVAELLTAEYFAEKKARGGEGIKKEARKVNAAKEAGGFSSTEELIAFAMRAKCKEAGFNPDSPEEFAKWQASLTSK